MDKTHKQLTLLGAGYIILSYMLHEDHSVPAPAVACQQGYRLDVRRVAPGPAVAAVTRETGRGMGEK